MYSVSVLITELHGSVSTVQKLSRDSFPPTDELLISQVLWFVNKKCSKCCGQYQLLILISIISIIMFFDVVRHTYGIVSFFDAPIECSSLEAISKCMRSGGL